MNRILARLLILEKYARRLPLSQETQEDFLSYCSLMLFEGRDVRTKNLMFYVDFMRLNYGRKTDGRWPHEIITYQTIEENQEPRTNEQSIIERLYASQQVKRIMRNLDYEEQLLIYFFYFDDLNLKEIAEIFGVSESAVSQKHKKILRKIRKFNFVAKTDIQL